MSWRKNPVRIMTRMEPIMDWQEELKFMLIEAGTEGINQTKLTVRFDKWKTADEIRNELEVLAAQHKVQKFIIKGRGRPKTVWRATTEIFKS